MTADSAAWVDPMLPRPLAAPTTAPPGYEARLGPVLPPCARPSHANPGLSAGDVDGDGDLDLLAAHCDKLVLLRNDGAGAFETTERPMADEAMIVITAYLDADDVLDAVWAGFNSVRTLIGTGDGSFEEVDLGIRYCDTCEHPQGAPDGDVISALAMVDVDGDGDEDLLIGGTSRGSFALHETFASGRPSVALPTELWLSENGQFVRDTSWPLTRGYTLHTLVAFDDRSGEVEFVLLSDSANPGSDWPEIDQLGSSMIVRGRPGAWEERSFRELGFEVGAPMGGVLMDIDGDGLDDLLVSDVGGVRALAGAGPELGFVDASAVWGLAPDGPVTWSVVPVDPQHSSATDFFVNGGALPDFAWQPGTSEDLFLRWDDGFKPAPDGLLDSRVRPTRGFISADLTGDGRPDLIGRENVLGSETPEGFAGVHRYVDRGGAGHVVELRFDPACTFNGADIRVAQLGLTQRFLPYHHGGSFGNAAPDRTWIGIGELDAAEIEIWRRSGPYWAVIAGADTSVFIPCGEG